MCINNSLIFPLGNFAKAWHKHVLESTDDEEISNKKRKRRSSSSSDDSCIGGKHYFS